jgi:predicted Fe-S protein YdhL (DUF1289 family)
VGAQTVIIRTISMPLRILPGYGHADSMNSPCNQTCKIDQRTGYCQGCGRDIAEIQEWPDSADAVKLQILAALPARLARMARTASK